MQNVSAFVSMFLGRPNVGDTVENSGQCVGLVERWLDYNEKLHIWGDAKDLLKNAPVGSYHIYHNTPQNYPSPGSVLVWDGTWGDGHGHCAVVVGANVNWLAVFEQNNPTGSHPVVATHGYHGVVGWLTW